MPTETRDMHKPDVDACGELTGVCICGRKLISERGVMRLWCKKSRPQQRSIASLRVFCPQCLGHSSGIWLTEDKKLADEDVVFGHDGEALCLACGTAVMAHVGGWDRPVRATCLGCGKLLEKRQVKWCSRRAGRWQSVCAIAWSKPSLLRHTLYDMQHRICGICLLPINHWSEIEVDHVIPLAAGGPRSFDNLRAAHGRCNKAKSDDSLAYVRARMGITQETISQRLHGLPDDVKVMLRSGDLAGELTSRSERRMPAQRVPEEHMPISGIAE